MNRNRQLRAMLFSVAFFFLQFVDAKKSVTANTETASATIERAQNLMLQNERLQAISLLYRALKRENSKSQNYAEIKKAIAEISEVFISENAQQLFEMAVSLRKAEPVQSQQKLLEALKLEPENSLVISELGRVYIARNECGTALDLAAKHLNNNELNDQLLLLRYQAETCLMKPLEQPLIAPETFAKRNGPSALWWLLVDLERAHKQRAIKSTLDLLAQIKKVDPQAPQIDYWKYRTAPLTIKSISDANKYIMTCKNMTAAQFRRYMLDANLCRNLGELESEIKTIPTNSN
ncbi:MAG: hypothetical protein ACLGGX_01910 [Bdellovibrionia bacterium]